MGVFPNLNDFIRNALWAVCGILAIIASITQIESTAPEWGGLNLWVWVAIALILAVVVTILGHFIRKGRLPIIQIAIQHNDLTEKLYADVTNKGAEGRFEAQIRIVESTNFLLEVNQGIYQGYWEENKRGEVIIPHGETKRLLIAEFHKSSYSGYLRIFSESFGGYHELNHSYNLLGENINIIIPEVFLILTISSSPSPISGNEIIGLRIWANNKYQVDYSMSRKKQAKAIEKGLTKTQFHKMHKVASQPINKSKKGKSQAYTHCLIENPRLLTRQ